MKFSEALKGLADAGHEAIRDPDGTELEIFAMLSDADENGDDWALDAEGIERLEDGEPSGYRYTVIA